MLDAANRELERSVKGFDREVQKRLKSYSWPGNIRELRMVVRRATLLAKDDWITTTEIGIPDKGRQPEVYSLNDERTERATILKALGATGNDRKGCRTVAGHQPEHALPETEEVPSGLEYVRNSDTSCPIHNAFLYTSFLLLSIWFIYNVFICVLFQAWHFVLIPAG